MSYSWLPELLAEIAEAAGLEAALRIAEMHGGTRKRIPAHLPTGDHWLTDCVDQVAAAAICKQFRQGSGSGRFRGAYVLIPRGPTGAVAAARRRMVQELQRGASAAEAARAAGMTERSAYRARARHRRRDDSQGNLF